MPEALLAGPGAARALATAGTGSVLAPLTRGGYVAVGDAVVAVVPPRAPLGPLSLLAPGVPAFAGGERVVWDGTVLRIGGWTAAAGGLTVSAAPPPGPCRDGARAAMAAVLASLAPLPPGLADGVGRLGGGDPGGGARCLAGRGPGLTPAGDDVLAGWAAWRVWDGDPVPAGEAVAAAAGRTNPISAAYLSCAARGELPEPAHRVAAAVRDGDLAAAARRARALSAWGASSGAALAWGMAAALAAPAARVRAPVAG